MIVEPRLMEHDGARSEGSPVKECIWFNIHIHNGPIDIFYYLGNPLYLFNPLTLRVTYAHFPRRLINTIPAIKLTPPTRTLPTGAVDR